jgi:uncharacterized membrane protein
VTWAVLLLAAPWLGSNASAPGLAVVSASTYVVGSIVCHQRPERTFHVAGGHLPVCARCAGLYLSTAAGAVLGGLYLLGRARRDLAFRPGAGDPATGTNWRLTLLLAALPTLATLAAEWMGVARPSNAVRALAAVPMGLAVGVVLTAGLSFRGRL